MSLSLVLMAIVIPLFFVLAVGICISNAFAQNQPWLKWIDPDKQFSLQYPSNWTATPRENRFEDQDISLDIDNLTRMTVDVYNTTSTDLRAIMERSAATEGHDNTPIKVKIFEGPEYDTYTVSGKPAGSITWVADVPFLGKAARLNIASLVGDKFVGILYTTTAQEFDKHLPLVEKVIQSIKVK